MINFVRNKLQEVGSNIVLGSSVKIDEALIAADSIGLTKLEVSQYAHPSNLWLIFSGIGILCIIGLLLYQKFIGTRSNN